MPKLQVTVAGVRMLCAGASIRGLPTQPRAGLCRPYGVQDLLAEVVMRTQAAVMYIRLQQICCLLVALAASCERHVEHS